MILYEKSHADFSEMIDRLLGYIEEKLAQDAPALHKIFYRSTDDYIFIRRIIRLIGAYIICESLLIIFKSFTLKDLDFYNEKIILTIMILTFCHSVQVRAIVCLILPTLMISTSGLFLYVKLIQALFGFIFPLLNDNIIGIISMLICLIHARKFEIRIL